ncbi:hypothetical protein H6F75_00320 [Nodosilinea sp. FACHB-131]|uniref:hypothetical protein n=1 Tax=Cyanophyceae TaxID=3028117 RepID=UPI001684D6B2|nr:hypothetical protein [Nodosilinea sp. FACHB-131]MBD1871914.1 hypothetical protein [Nodosilinea sp. FACHB-131]
MPEAAFTSNRWKVSDAGLEGILESITRKAKGLPKHRLAKIETMAKVSVDQKIAEFEKDQQQEDIAAKSYACQAGSTAEVELFRLCFEQKQVQVLKSHFREYDPSLGYWRRIDDDEIRHSIIQEAEKAYWVDGKGKRKGTLAHIKNVNNAMAWAAGKLYKKTDTTFNRDLLAFQNGTVSTKTGKLSPHDPGNLLTASVPHNYIEGAECPEPMRRYIESSFDGDYNYIRACIALMLDMTAPHRFLHLQGSSGSGKGLFIRLIQSIFSSESTQAANSFSIFKDPDKVRQFISGRRVVAISDINEFIDSGLATFYDSVECSPVAARNLHSSKADNEVNYTRYIVASAKGLLMASSSSGGFERRVVPVLTQPIPNEQRSEQFENELMESVPDVVSWALSMDRELRDKILKNPKRYNERAAQYFNDIAASTSSVWAFANECLEPADIHGPRQPVQVGWLYSCYKAYCAAANVRAHALNNWKAEMKSILTQNIVDRRHIGGEMVPIEWVWINIRHGLFESNSGIPECIVSKLGEGGVELFRAWATQYGHLYPYDARTLPEQLAQLEAAVQGVQDVQDQKAEEFSNKENEGDQQKEELNRDYLGAVPPARPESTAETLTNGGQESLVAVDRSRSVQDQGAEPVLNRPAPPDQGCRDATGAVTHAWITPGKPDWWQEFEQRLIEATTFDQLQHAKSKTSASRRSQVMNGWESDGRYTWLKAKAERLQREAAGQTQGAIGEVTA